MLDAVGWNQAVKRLSAMERWGLWIGIGGSAATHGVGTFLGVPGLSLAAMVTIPTGIVLFFSGWSRRRRFLRRMDLRVCPSCFQVLRGLPDTGVCPECGRPYVIERVRATWQKAYPSLQLPSNDLRDSPD